MSLLSNFRRALQSFQRVFDLLTYERWVVGQHKERLKRYSQCM